MKEEDPLSSQPVDNFSWRILGNLTAVRESDSADSRVVGILTLAVKNFNLGKTQKQ